MDRSGRSEKKHETIQDIDWHAFSLTRLHRMRIFGMSPRQASSQDRGEVRLSVRVKTPGDSN